MEKLIKIMEEIDDGIDYENCNTLIDEGYLDSLAIISLIASIEEEFDVQIPTVEVIPANFNSVKSIWKLIIRLEEEG